MWWPFSRQAASHGRFVRIPLAELRIGMYVWLPCRWYQHPFPSNRFRVTNAQQVTIIRRLSLRTVYYDPTLSDCQQTASGPALRPEGASTTPMARAPAAIPTSQSPASRAVETYQRSVQQTESILREAMKEDSVEAGHQAHQLILHLTEQLMSGTLPVGIGRIAMINQAHHSAAVHALETTLLALVVGRELSLTPDALETVGIAALLHDLGEYLEAPPGRMCVAAPPPMHGGQQRHPEYGRRLILRMAGLPSGIAEVVYQHHEHLDGSGYPRQLRDEAIHPLARLLRVIDAYVDLLNEADLGRRYTPQQALSELYVVHKAQLCSQTMVALVRVLTIYPPGSFVELTNGAIALVVQIHPHDRLRPLLLVHPSALSVARATLVDLASTPEIAITRALGLRDIPPTSSRTLRNRTSYSIF